MSDTWTNWSGAIACRPAVVEWPRDEGAVADAVRRAARDGRVVRPVGAGHSSSGLCATDGVLLSLEHWTGIESIDPTSSCVTVRAGTVLHDLGALLLEHGLALENLGDIDRQAVAGALATGTHGTGRALGNLSSRVRGLRLVTADGALLSIDAAQPELAGARVSLGALGVVTAVTLHALPAYRQVLDTFTEEAARHRHFECFYFPRHDFASRLAHLYPRWADFAALRSRLDRDGRFLNAHLRDLLLDPPAAR